MTPSEQAQHAHLMQRFRERVTTRYPVLFAMREAVGLGLAAVRAYKLRAGLTILGVVMGVMTVTGMTSIIAGLNQNVAATIQGMGASVIFVRPFEPGKHLSSEEWRRRKWLSQNEARLIAERCRDVKAVAPIEPLQAGIIKHGNEQVQDAQVFGTTREFETVHEYYVERGRFFSEAESKGRARMAVIGIDIADALFPSVDPVGKEIMVGNRRYTVVGVLERKGKVLGQSRDNMLLVPLGSFESHPPDFNYLAVDLIPTSTDKIEDAIEQVREVLRRSRRLRFWQTDTFGIFTQDTFTDLYRRLTGGIYMVMIAISCIGLVVGGVGVMNIMLVSVTERTREIGVRKALGATKRDLRWQFLTEAMTLTGLGGVIGILVGAIVAWIVNLLSPFPATLQPTWVLLAFLSSVGVGLTFGLWPAAKAARLDPIEALRYE